MKYVVTLEKLSHLDVEVEAPDHKTAEQAALARLNAGDYGPEDWGCEEVDVDAVYLVEED